MRRIDFDTDEQYLEACRNRNDAQLMEFYRSIVMPVVTRVVDESRHTNMLLDEQQFAAAYECLRQLQQMNAHHLIDDSLSWYKLGVADAMACLALTKRIFKG